MASLNTEVSSSKPVPPPAVTYSDPHDALRAAPKVLIKVHKTGRPEEPEDVFVGVNGVGYQIKRGEPVTVPEPVVKVLENAVQTVYIKGRDSEGREIMKPNEVQAYPFTRLN